MTTLVTGAAGLLGSHVTRAVVARGERPRAMVRPGESTHRLAGLEADTFEADMGDPAALAKAVQGVDRVLHCAARTGPWGPAAEYETANVRGLRVLVEAAVAAGVKRIVHVSSITVHGNDVRGAADESSPFREEPNPYSRSKVAGERLLETIIRDQAAPVTIVRPGWIYGPGDTASFGRFAAMIQKGRMVGFGSGANHVPLIFVSDVADGILLASEVERALGRTYLLVNDEPVTQAGYFGAIAAALGVPPPRLRIPYRLALVLGATSETAGRLARMQNPPPLMRYGIQLIGGENRFSIARARQELGFSPQVMLAEGVRRGVEWFRETGGAAQLIKEPA
ncbi:MAG TPA: NAD-dependent epimerase/dehydratase family protein [Patescibacteria group bacterium]|nr:NAD-dependent epimerase/dehydratase family protein [Patescibacteria group bacterium]